MRCHLFEIKTSRQACFSSWISLGLERLTAVSTISAIKGLFPLNQLPHPQRQHPHTAVPLNLLPPALIHPQPLCHRLAGNTAALQQAGLGVQLPPVPGSGHQLMRIANKP
jgi:hypothetical protein